MGIAHDDLETIFDPFQRAQADSEVDGSGLGLAICRKLLNEMGGSLHVKSTLNQGSIFSLELPVNLGADNAPLPSHPEQTCPAPTTVSAIQPSGPTPDRATRQRLLACVKDGDISLVLNEITALEADFPEFAASCRKMAKNFQLNQLTRFLAVDSNPVNLDDPA